MQGFSAPGPPPGSTATRDARLLFHPSENILGEARNGPEAKPPRLQQPASGQVAHQGPDAKGPGAGLIRMNHGVDQRAQQRG